MTADPNRSPANLPAPRRYDEKEVRRLLERAAQLQGAPPGARPHTGLTLHELEEIAAEAGIDVASVRQAAVELDAAATPMESAGARLAGGPTRVVLEHAVPGEFDPASFTDLLPAIQRAAGLPGQASQVGRTLTWATQNPNHLRQLQVTISVRAGSTHVWIEERYSAMLGAVYGGGLSGIGIGVGGALGGVLGGALGSVAIGIALPALLIGGTYAACRRFYGGYVEKRRRVLEQLLHELVARF